MTGNNFHPEIVLRTVERKRSPGSIKATGGRHDHDQPKEEDDLMTLPTAEDMRRLVEMVKKPDNSFDLHDIETAVAAEFDLSAKDARRIVQAWDRQNCISPDALDAMWTSADSRGRA
jgi:hypothetical protein